MKKRILITTLIIGMVLGSTLPCCAMDLSSLKTWLGSTIETSHVDTEITISEEAVDAAKETVKSVWSGIKSTLTVVKKTYVETDTTEAFEETIKIAENAGSDNTDPGFNVVKNSFIGFIKSVQKFDTTLKQILK